MAKKTSTGTKIAEGLGIAALAAAAAGTYYFYGPGGKKHRQKISAWTKSAKTEMVSKIKNMKTVSKQAYENASKQVLAKYKQAKNIDPQELSDLAQELKKHWHKISKDISVMGAKKKATKIIRTATKKTPRK